MLEVCPGVLNYKLFVAYAYPMRKVGLCLQDDAEGGAFIQC